MRLYDDGHWVRYEDHAARVAALVAQLEAANKLLEETTDDALKQRVEFWREACQNAEAALEAERADHDEFGQFKRAETLVAQLAELTRERDEAVSDHDAIHEQLRDAQSEVTRLTEALAAANRGAAENGEAADTYRERAEAAEARVRELEAALAAAELNFEAADNRYQDAAAHNRDLTQALAAKEQGGSRWCTVCQQRAEAAEARVEGLETLLAASEARAAQWQADAEGYRADATVAQDRLAALRARVERAAAVMTLAFGSFMPEWPGATRDALEILRG